MSRVIPKAKVKPAPKRKPTTGHPREILTQEQIDQLLSVAEGGDSVAEMRRRKRLAKLQADIEAELEADLGVAEAAPTPVALTPKQQLLLAGATMAALVGLIAEYPRRHTIDFEGIVRARFMDGVREIQHKEREAGLKGGLADLTEADCRMTLDVPE